jgi:hypothetical protein
MKAQLKIGFCFAAMCVALGLCAPNAHAFALLGPFQPWMQTTNGVFFSSDIGGPMCISNEYRWNVPVVTYGFDQSFLDNFGTNGVAAVESAIQILNSLPPASQIALTNYPFDSRPISFVAQSQSLYDLKSQTLSLLLEHLGLAQPTRYVYVLKQWDSSLLPSYPNGFSSPLSWPDGTIPEFVLQLNFDPQTLDASTYINHNLYSAFISISPNQYGMIPIAVDPLASSYTAVTDSSLNSGGVVNNEIYNGGGFYTGLTYDDVGGLAYLLSTNNVNYENLLPNIVGIGTNANSFVNGAWRPGMDKITFIPQPVDSQSGAFLPTTNYFTDSYITNGILKQQQMARIISQPDFLFSAGDVTSGIPEVLFYTRTGTTNWLNNATANGNINGAGPGVIQPPVQIMFNKLGQQFYGGGNLPDEAPLAYQSTRQSLGSFDGSANAPIVYPALQSGTKQFTVRMWLELGTYPNWSTTSFTWKPASAPSAQFLFQTSTNLNDWVILETNLNDGNVTTYFLNNPKSPTRFYRLVPQ